MSAQNDNGLRIKTHIKPVQKAHKHAGAIKFQTDRPIERAMISSERLLRIEKCAIAENNTIKGKSLLMINGIFKMHIFNVNKEINSEDFPKKDVKVRRNPKKKNIAKRAKNTWL